MSEYVYVLSNESMPGLVKIGMTTNHPKERARDLTSSTGVPSPFVVEYFKSVPDCYEVEQDVHYALDEYRINPNREFFKVEPAIVVAELQRHEGTGEIFDKHEHDKWASKLEKHRDREAYRAMAQRRKQTRAAELKRVRMIKEEKRIAKQLKYERKREMEQWQANIEAKKKEQPPQVKPGTYTQGATTKDKSGEFWGDYTAGVVFVALFAFIAVNLAKHLFH